MDVEWQPDEPRPLACFVVQELLFKENSDLWAESESSASESDSSSSSDEEMDGPVTADRASPIPVKNEPELSD